MTKDSNLYAAMAELVEKYVSHYKDDFYIYDKEIITKNKKVTRYYWFLRESGTNIVNVDEVGYSGTSHNICAEYYLNSAKKVYTLEIEKFGRINIYGKIKEIKKSVIEDMLKNAKKEKWFVKEYNGTTIECCSEREAIAHRERLLENNSYSMHWQE